MELCSFDFKPTSVAEARQALDNGPAHLMRQTAELQGWTRRTPSAQDQRLLPIAGTWLMELHPSVRPVLLAKVYPRIINRLCLFGTYSKEIRGYLDELLLDNRGGRQGFQYDIAMELATLRAHYQAIPIPTRDSAMADLAFERRPVR